MVKLKVIAPFLLIALVACNLTDLTGVNVTFTTTSDVPTSTATPVVIVVTATPTVEASTPTPPVVANTVTPVVIVDTATPAVSANTVTPIALIHTPTPIGGAQTIDPAVEAKNIKTITIGRAAELLRFAKNAHDLLKEIRNGQITQPGPLNKLNDLNGDLAHLWLKIAGNGLGIDPFFDNIRFSSWGAFSRAEPHMSYGISGPYNYWGLPRLYERFAELASQAGQVISTPAEFTNLVAAYSNPARYPHQGFYDRAYANYREGKELSSPQYTADLEALDQWLTELESVLEKIPSYFAK